MKLPNKIEFTINKEEMLKDAFPYTKVFDDLDNYEFEYTASDIDVRVRVTYKKINFSSFIIFESKYVTHDKYIEYNKYIDDWCDDIHNGKVDKFEKRYGLNVLQYSKAFDSLFSEDKRKEFTDKFITNVIRDHKINEILNPSS